MHDDDDFFLSFQSMVFWCLSHSFLLYFLLGHWNTQVAAKGWMVHHVDIGTDEISMKMSMEKDLWRVLHNKHCIQQNVQIRVFVRYLRKIRLYSLLLYSQWAVTM